MSFVPVLGASILDPIYNAMGWTLAFFYSLIASYGVAIALLTVAVRIFLIPLTTKQVKSQQAMQRIQPELKRLQAKHKNDRQKLNEEMMKFYKENKVNPLAGCLPILLQAPLFIVLYRLIIDLNADPEPKHLPRDSKLFTSLLESGGQMVSWGIDLAESATAGGSVGHYLLVALTVVTGYYQQRQMTARMPKGAVNPQMQMITKIFPAMIGLISLSVPAGVVVYFIVSNLWQIGQQEVMFRILPPPHVESGKGEKGDKADKGARGDGKGDKGGAPSGKGGGGGKGGAGGNARASGGSGRSGGSRSGGSGGSGSGGSAKKQNNRAQSKGKRPPPSPRPKGLPPKPKPEQKGTPARGSRRKDT